ncbi:hypothetical protein [Chitinophaga nivalis]|uniref:Uncharacterized protein n=1 Tax=Chitinophaga nivalis TaxID=2991709 RepID=A0ABT3IL15_9BACT|nr:hypothetical protein [Chitinophaga nivalis]MCW3465829.1 hypothetical protein [Chitinophaga nivalis]MCW3484480.1 hypothetical protein [Chitinophaga nivalis]
MAVFFNELFLEYFSVPIINSFLLLNNDEMLIIQFLDSRFRLHYLTKINIADSLGIDNTTYFIDDESKENNGFIGFFDWLRSSESTIVGIRMCIFEHHKYNNILGAYPYTKSANDGKWIELMFSGDDYNSEISGDQDFTNNYVYKSNNNDYLITFGLDHLAPGELDSLLVHCSIVA